MGFQAVHQDLLVRPAKDPVVAFDACTLERVDAKVAESCFRVVPTKFAWNEGGYFVGLKA